MEYAYFVSVSVLIPSNLWWQLVDGFFLYCPDQTNVDFYNISLIKGKVLCDEDFCMCNKMKQKKQQQTNHQAIK